jgi:hypothetical protein
LRFGGYRIIVTALSVISHNLGDSIQKTPSQLVIDSRDFIEEMEAVLGDVV